MGYWEWFQVQSVFHYILKMLFLGVVKYSVTDAEKGQNAFRKGK